MIKGVKTWVPEPVPVSVRGARPYVHPLRRHQGEEETAQGGERGGRLEAEAGHGTV